MSEIDPTFLSIQTDTTQEILDIRSKFPPRAPLSAQLELAWLNGDDETFSELNAGINRIQEITGRHNII